MQTRQSALPCSEKRRPGRTRVAYPNQPNNHHNNPELRYNYSGNMQTARSEKPLEVKRKLLHPKWRSRLIRRSADASSGSFCCSVRRRGCPPLIERFADEADEASALLCYLASFSITLSWFVLVRTI